MTPNDALMELLLMIDAAVGASAHRVIAVTPWFGYSRQDKKSAPREPISARLVARMLESAGADRVLTMDLHAGQIQGFFQKPVDHMTALFMLTQYFRDLQLEDLVVVSPDAGRVKLAKKFAAKIGAELAILNKERPAQQVAEIGYVIGDVEGQDRRARRRHDRHRGHAQGRRPDRDRRGRHARLRRRHARRLLAATRARTWPSAPFEQIVVTDTIPLRPGAPDNIQVLSCADLLTDSIRRIFTDDSVSEVFGGENQLTSCSERAARLQDLLGPDDEELLAVLDADPLEVIARRARPPARAADPARPAGRGRGAGRRAGAAPLGAARGPGGRPLDPLLARDFGALRGRAGDARRARLRPARRRLSALLVRVRALLARPGAGEVVPALRAVAVDRRRA